MSDAVTQDSWFEEIDRFDPVEYLEAQYVAYTMGRSLLWKTVLDDSDSLETSLLDGILEPFAIRILPSFWSHSTPNDVRSLKGALMDGNEDAATASDQVETIYVYDVNIEQTPFVDKVLEVDGTILMNSNFRTSRSDLKAFVDVRLVGNTTSSLGKRTPTMSAFMSHMTGSTDNYISYRQRSAACGFTYDTNVEVGTDSIAFGGMVY